MSWGEAYRHARTLSADPSSALAAALAGWDTPVSREALILMDVFDSLEFARVHRKAKRYHRPWGDKTKRQVGRARLTRDELRALLDTHRANPGPREVEA